MLIIVTATLSVISFFSLKSTSYEAVEQFTNESVMRLRDNVTAMLDEHESLLKHSAVGIAILLEDGLPPREKMQKYFRQMMATLPDVSFLYFSNNLIWDDPGGYFVLNEEWIPDHGYDQTTRPWFSEAKEANGKIAYAEPYIDAAYGKLTIAMSMTIFDTEGKDIGVASEELTVDALSHILAKSDRDIWIIDTKGCFITHNDPSFIMKKDFFTENNLEHYRSQVINNASFSTLDNAVFISSAKVTGKDWVLVSIVPAATIFTATNRALIMMLFLSMALLVAGIAISTIVTRKMSAPLRDLQKFSEKVAEGDFSNIALNYRSSEASRLSEGFNAINKNISALVRTITGNAISLEKIGTELSDTMAQSLIQVSQITRRTEDMNNKAISQSASVTETNEAMDKIVSNIDKLNTNIEDQTDKISESSKSVEDMIMSIAQINKNLIKNKENVDKLSAASEQGHSAIEQISQDIQQVAKESERLLEINAVMENISSKTNILSMNAAIEAAHAGEVGKGFAVVADEIRKLADSSGEQAKTVSQVLKKIKDALDGINKSTAVALGHFAVIENTVKTVTEEEVKIRKSVEEQDAGSQYILQTINNSLTITQNVKNGSEEMLTGSQQIISEGKHLELVTQDLKQGINEITSSINQLSTAVKRVSEISRQNNESVQTVVHELSRFIIQH
jgi:methyl-accepting chemotaxis protein